MMAAHQASPGSVGVQEFPSNIFSNTECSALQHDLINFAPVISHFSGEGKIMHNFPEMDVKT